jgi:hypothetical protein
MQLKIIQILRNVVTKRNFFLRDDNGGFAYIEAAAAANYCDDNMLS